MNRHGIPWRALGLAAAALLHGCGGGGGGSSTGGTSDPGDASRSPALAITGHAVVKARVNDTSWAVLTERLRRLEDVTTPERQLRVSAGAPSSEVIIVPPAGWSLIDFAQHPSGHLTLVLATDTQLRLQRHTSDGNLFAAMDFHDTQAQADPYMGDDREIRNPQSLLPWATRDAVRLAAHGEDLVLALRTGRHAVVAQRLSLNGGGFNRVWRTLVEPGVYIDGTVLTSGSFDPFGRHDSQWSLLLDVDAQGRSAIAVNLGLTELAEGHRRYFGEPVDPAIANGTLVTRLDAQGRRLSAVVINTGSVSEVHALRWAGDMVLAAGRVLSDRRADGSGWDAYLALLPSAASQPATLQILDFDRGDIVRDLAVLPDGRLLLAGSTGYLQNPEGASVSEAAAPLLAIAATPGAAPQRIGLPPAPRHNQVRSVLAWQGHWMIGGLRNGPGTHSADTDTALLSADGYWHEQGSTMP